AGDAKEYLAKLIRFGDLLHFGARVSDGDEAIANFFFTHFSLYALKKLLLVDVRLEGASRFARNDAHSALEVHFRFDGPDLRGVGGIQNMKLGMAFDFSKRHAQNFGTETGTSHAQQERVFESSLLH